VLHHANPILERIEMRSRTHRFDTRRARLGKRPKARGWRNSAGPSWILWPRRMPIPRARLPRARPPMPPTRTMPRELFARAQKLHWICASRAGFGGVWLYDPLVESDVTVAVMHGS
jgi:hypothetical protein